MRLADHPSGSSPGTYALHLELDAPVELELARLGPIRLEPGFYLYFGSAFGPGGVAARIRHHLRTAPRAHWHIDHLRQVAKVRGVWYTFDAARLECTWASAASALRGVAPILRFGSSDCRCDSHLLMAQSPPTLSAFRRRLNALRPGCARIRQL